jgi:hypothetical protein
MQCPVFFGHPVYTVYTGDANILYKVWVNNNNGLLTEREVCTVKYQTEVF